MSTILGIDIETYSSVPLPKCGVYRYVDAPDFEILLLSYAFDDGPVITIDLACGEKLPVEVAAALDDPTVIKVAYNAQFERVCLSMYLGHWLDPRQWRCTAVMASYLTLPSRLADVAVALKLTKQKMEEGKELIRYFSVPCKPTKGNGGRMRNLPADAPDKWAVYKQYNAQDVETERAVRKALEAWPLPEHEWDLYALDQIINDRGVRVDKRLVKNAIAVDEVFTEAAYRRAKELTGLENPGSVAQLKAWLADQDMPMESLAKKIVQEKAAKTEGLISELLNLRLELSKTSVKKYEAMARTVCRDGRIHGLLQFGGASRTFRWAGRLVQIQNLPQNHLPDLMLARSIVRQGDEQQLELLFGSVPNTLSELIRTAFIPKDGCRFIVADFSAIEARVLAWLAGEDWVLEEFRGKGKIYEATASRMFHIPQETIVKGNPNYEYRQKGKQATLSCGYGGGVGALKAMGAKMPEEEMQPLVDAWRAANPNIVAFWGALDRAARKVIRRKASSRVGKVTLYWKDDKMLVRLPSGRNLCYQSPHFTGNRFGSDAIGYYAPNAAGQMVEQETFGGKLAENVTAVTGVQLPNGGILKTLHLPATVTNLTIRNQKAITDFSIGGYDNISTLRLENVSEVFDLWEILHSIPSGSRVRVTGLERTFEDAADILEFYDLLDTMRGLDENGNNTDKAQISGVFTIDTLTGNELAEMQERYPNIRIQYEHTHSNVYFYDDSGDTLLKTVTVYDGGDAAYGSSNPTKVSTAQYSYSFTGWSLSAGGSANANALKAVMVDRNVYAAYARTVRKYTVYFYNGSTLLKTVSNVPYGSGAYYSGDTPVKTGVDFPEDYVFTGWSPSNNGITGNTYCYAQYKYIGYTYTSIVEGSIAGEYANDRVAAVGDYVFRDCTALTGVSLPSVESIGVCAFLSCTKLTGVSIPSILWMRRYHSIARMEKKKSLK